MSFPAEIKDEAEHLLGSRRRSRSRRGMAAGPYDWMETAAQVAKPVAIARMSCRKPKGYKTSAYRTSGNPDVTAGRDRQAKQPMTLREQGQMRAALNRTYVLVSNGVERWSRERAEKARRAAERRKRYELETGRNEGRNERKSC